MSKLLIITGPTATGKTALAVSLAKKYSGEIISADSRQVYRFMDFGTGKDLPKNPQYFDQNDKFTNRNPRHSYGFYLFDNVPVWGLDIVEPDYSFNVSDFVEYAQAVISDINKRGRLPIIVGGTGLYLRGLLGQIDTLGSVFDEKLRRELDGLSLEELQTRLKKDDPEVFGRMNQSDQKNSRRLIRAIEISENPGASPQTSVVSPKDTLIFVLSAPIDFILQKIEKRDRGEIVQEVTTLLRKGLNFSQASMTSLGYRVFAPISEKLLSGVTTEDEISASLLRWNQQDRQYAKRQLAFLKKYFPNSPEPNLKTNWVDITSSDWQNKVNSILIKWYT